MQFWSARRSWTPQEAVPVARMLDEAGYDGIVCSDHMIYPRELSSPYPDSPTGKPGWAARHRVARLLGAHRRDGRGDEPAAVLQRGLRRARPPAARSGQAGGDRVRVCRTGGCRWRRASGGCARSTS